MAEALKRWTGAEWVTVSAVNRIEASGSGGGLLAQPTYTTDWPIAPFDTPYETLTPISNLALSYSYEIT